MVWGVSRSCRRDGEKGEARGLRLEDGQGSRGCGGEVGPEAAGQADRGAGMEEVTRNGEERQQNSRCGGLKAGIKLLDPHSTCPLTTSSPPAPPLPSPYCLTPFHCFPCFRSRERNLK